MTDNAAATGQHTRVVDVTRMPGSDLGAHAALDSGTGMLTLSDPMESYGLVAGDPVRGTTFSLAPVLDPFGLRWSIMTRVEDISPQESARRGAAWAATQQA